MNIDDDNYERSLLGKEKCLMVLKEKLEAENVLIKVINKNNKNKESHYRLGLYYFSAKRYKEAISILNKVKI